MTSPNVSIIQRLFYPSIPSPSLASGGSWHYYRPPESGGTWAHHRGAWAWGIPSSPGEPAGNIRLQWNQRITDTLGTRSFIHHLEESLQRGVPELASHPATWQTPKLFTITGLRQLMWQLDHENTASTQTVRTTPRRIRLHLIENIITLLRRRQPYRI